MGKITVNRTKLGQVEDTIKLAQYLREKGYGVANSYGEVFIPGEMEIECGFEIQDPAHTEVRRSFLFYPLTRVLSIGSVKVQPKEIRFAISRDYMNRLEVVARDFSKQTTKNITLDLSVDYPRKDVLDKKGENIHRPSVVVEL
jgi:hypothetical protein